MGRGSRAGHRAPLPLRRPARISGTLPPRAAVLSWTGAGAASAGWARPLAGLVKVGDLLMVLDGSFGSGGRGALGPVPQLQVPQDLFNDRAVADQADDFERSGAAGTDEGIEKQDAPPEDYCGRFMRRRRSWKPGSDRKASH